MTFLPMSQLNYEHRAGADRRASLPVPVRRPAGLRLASFMLGGVWAKLGRSREETLRLENLITPPLSIDYLDPRSGEIVEDGPYLNEKRASYFGIPDPQTPDGEVGRYDDPSRPPKERLELLRQRIYSALDVLLPLFADENTPWTEQATKAAQEVRDFFPLAAEPGLWPYYKFEGREFFAWVERHAPPAKAPVPWEGRAD